MLPDWILCLFYLNIVKYSAGDLKPLQYISLHVGPYIRPSKTIPVIVSSKSILLLVQ